MSVGDVSGVSETASTSQTDDTQATSSTVATTGVATVGQLPKALEVAICESIAYNICSAASDSNQRLHDILAEAEHE